MLPRESSLTYFNDLIEHYRDVNRRILAAPFKPKPQAAPVAPRAPPEPEPEPVPPDVIEAALAGLDEEHAAKIRSRHICIRIINEVCLEYDVTREELISPSRTLKIARIRQLAMWRCRQAGVSLPVIGRYFGNRDHTTVLHAVRKIEAMKADEAAE